MYCKALRTIVHLVLLAKVFSQPPFSILSSSINHLALLYIFSPSLFFVLPVTSHSASLQCQCQCTQPINIRRCNASFQHFSFQVFLQLSAPHNAFYHLPCCRTSFHRPLYFLPPSTLTHCTARVYTALHCIIIIQGVTENTLPLFNFRRS